MSARTWTEVRRLAADVPPLGTTHLALEAAHGHALAEPVRALVDLPGHETAAMDGYAVRGPGPWRCIGLALAGASEPLTLADGDAVEVATGAEVPAGTEGVLHYESAERDGQTVRGEHPRGRHVRHVGEECRAGDTLLGEGTVVSPGALALAAAAGYDELPVRRRPDVRCVVTGDELLRAGPPTRGMVRDALGPMLPLLCRDVGAAEAEVEWLPDDAGALREALATSGADIVVTTGASSRGRADHLLPVLTDLGAEVLVDGVDVRPGHPQVLAHVPSGPWVVGLPGNPLAALVGIVTILEPLTRALAGLPMRPFVPARWTTAVSPHPTSTRLIPVRLQDGNATVTEWTGAAMLRGAATSDGLGVVPPGATAETGSVDVLLWPWSR